MEPRSPAQRFQCRGSAHSSENSRCLESIRTLSSSPLPAMTVVAAMTHMLPLADIALGHPGLQGGLQIDPNQARQAPQQPGQQPSSSGSSQKHRGADDGEGIRTAEPRCLRRSREVCSLRQEGRGEMLSPVYVFHLTQQKMACRDTVLAREGDVRTKGRSTELGIR